LAVLLFSIYNFAALATTLPCADALLTEKGWKVKGSININPTSNWLKSLLEDFPQDFSAAATFKMYSTSAQNWVELTLIDNFTTPQSEMYGDILWIRDLLTKDLIELRWYDGQKVSVLYAKNYQTCATNLVPFVDNSLY
jgi:hypothetical protein